MYKRPAQRCVAALLNLRWRVLFFSLLLIQLRTDRSRAPYFCYTRKKKKYNLFFFKLRSRRMVKRLKYNVFLSASLRRIARGFDSGFQLRTKPLQSLLLRSKKKGDSLLRRVQYYIEGHLKGQGFSFTLYREENKRQKKQRFAGI